MAICWPGPMKKGAENRHKPARTPAPMRYDIAAHRPGFLFSKTGNIRGFIVFKPFSPFRRRRVPGGKMPRC